MKTMLHIGLADVRSRLILLMCAGYFLQFVFHSDVVDQWVAIFVLVVFFSCLSLTRPVPRVMSLVMLFGGIGLHLSKGTELTEILQQVTANLPLLSLIILVPLISIPLRVDGYLNSIHYFLKRYSSQSQKVFAINSGFLFCLGPFLNLGSIRILHEMISDLRLNAVLLAKSYLVGFSTVVFWSPYLGSIALVLFYLDVPILSYLPYGLALAVIQWIIGNALFGLWLRGRGEETVVLKKEEGEDEPFHYRQMKRLFVTLILFLGVIFLLEFATGWPMMFLVSAFAVLYPLLWCLKTSKWKEASELFASYRSHSVPVMNNEVVLFISAGVFGKALIGTAAAQQINHWMTFLASKSIVLFMISVIAIVVVVTFLGVHQIVVVTALILQISPEAIGMRAEALALLFMMSWSISAVLSPFNPLNLLVSQSVNQPPLSVGMRWNGIYLLSIVLVGLTMVYWMG